MDTTEYLRNASNSIRDGFASIVDATLGKLGLVGEFLGGMAKRAFDLGLMLTPLGYAVFEEEATGTLAMYGMGVDAMYNSYRERYERLGHVISAIPEYLAHASAAEWGSLTIDMIPALISGGRTAINLASRIAHRTSGRIINSFQLRTGRIRFVRTVGRRAVPPSHLTYAEKRTLLRDPIERLPEGVGTRSVKNLLWIDIPYNL